MPAATLTCLLLQPGRLASYALVDLLPYLHHVHVQVPPLASLLPTGAPGAGEATEGALAAEPLLMLRQSTLAAHVSGGGAPLAATCGCGGHTFKQHLCALLVVLPSCCMPPTKQLVKATGPRILLAELAGPLVTTCLVTTYLYPRRPGQPGVRAAAHAGGAHARYRPGAVWPCAPGLRTGHRLRGQVRPTGCALLQIHWLAC